MEKWKPYQTDHLILIVGSNPLPNHVAASLLSKENGIIHLLHTSDTLNVAERLRTALKPFFSTEKPDNSRHISLKCIDVSKSEEIIKGVNEVLDRIDSDSQRITVGLNYTGGTKAMAVHVYRAIESRYPEAIFSYLDARNLTMNFDGRGAVRTKTLPIKDYFQISLEELIKLHFHLTKKLNVKQEPNWKCVELCKEIMKLSSDKDSFKKWRNWLKTRDPSRDPLCFPDANEPVFSGVLRAFDNMCGGKVDPQKVASIIGEKSFDSCRKWFLGTWLEEYTLWALTEIAEFLGLGEEYGMIPDEIQDAGTERKFQIDLAAVKGYQLFAISCKASDFRDACKEHLFEAYVRAIQLGGDEARIGLICCYNKPEELEREITEEWFTHGRVKVFGRPDLKDLPEKLKEWFETANSNISYGGY